MTLDDHLRARMKGDTQGQIDALNALADALNTDPELKAAAEARVGFITDDLAGRDYISRRTRDHIKQALELARGR